MKSKKVIVIAGPTAVGKSDVAVLLAKQIDAEIISADSSQIYKGFNIGSGKVSQEEKQGVVHHMLDILNFEQDFNVAQYKQKAEEIIANAFERNKNVIICGGTGLYIKALTEGFQFYNVERNEQLRQELESIAAEKGVEELARILTELNPEKASQTDLKNKIRLIRAIEIEKASGQKLAVQNPKFSYQIFVLNTDRKKLHQRISNRVDKMVENGLIEEVKGLIDQGANLSHSPFKSIGYKELYNFVKHNEGTLDDCKENIKIASRKYAKRQITWFKSVKNAVWIDAESKIVAAQEILNYLIENKVDLFN